MSVRNNKAKRLLSPASQEKLSFNFQYLTDDKDYSTTGMKAGEKGEILERLLEKLRELSQLSYVNASLQPKGRGIETISQSELYEKVQNICRACPVLEENEKVSVFRFDQQRRRAICTNGANNDQVLYILALDLHYDAYNHGK